MTDTYPSPPNFLETLLVSTADHMQTILSWSYGVWKNGSRFLYRKSNTSPCHSAEHMQTHFSIENEWKQADCYIKEDVIIFIWRKRIPFPQTSIEILFLAFADHMQTLLSWSYGSLTELAACLSFDVRKVSFRAREALCVQGALQLKKKTLNPFLNGNEWKQAAFLYKKNLFTVLLIVQTLLSWSYGVWHRMAADVLYRKSNTVLVIVQNTCKPISRLKMNGNRRDCYIKEDVIIFTCRKRMSIPPNLIEILFLATADHMSDITFMILWSLTELAACLSFDVRKVSFRAREALCVQGALQLQKKNTEPISQWKWMETSCIPI